MQSAQGSDPKDSSSQAEEPTPIDALGDAVAEVLQRGTVEEPLLYLLDGLLRLLMSGGCCSGSTVKTLVQHKCRMPAKADVAGISRLQSGLQMLCEAMLRSAAVQALEPCLPRTAGMREAKAQSAAELDDAWDFAVMLLGQARGWSEVMAEEKQADEDDIVDAQWSKGHATTTT